MNEQRAIQFLTEVRKPLLALHKAILDHERASYEAEYGPTTAASFLQVLINGEAFRWITPLSTVIANIDETLDGKDATADDRIGSAQSVRALFGNEGMQQAFLERYRALLQQSPGVLHEHARVAQVLRTVETT